MIPCIWVLLWHLFSTLCGGYLGTGTGISVTAGAPRPPTRLEHPPRPRCRSLGGLREGLVVELSNGGMAVVVKEDAEGVVLDANSMLAGKTLLFELELVGLER